MCGAWRVRAQLNDEQVDHSHEAITQDDGNAVEMPQVQPATQAIFRPGKSRNRRATCKQREQRRAVDNAADVIGKQLGGISPVHGIDIRRALPPAREAIAKSINVSVEDLDAKFPKSGRCIIA